MEKEREIIFEEVTPPQTLVRSIIAQIMKRRRRDARVRLGLFAGLLVGSGTALIPALQYAADEVSRSDFYRYIALLFSNGSAVFASWREFSLLLAESLPVMGLIAVFGALFFLVYSLRLIAKNMQMALLLT